MGFNWQVIAGIILRYRVVILILIGAITTFMWVNRGKDMVHDYAKIVPVTDPDYIDYVDFKKEFGEDGNVFIVGIEGDLFEKAFFCNLLDLTDSLSKIKGVTNVLSIANLKAIKRDSAKGFNLAPIFDQRPGSQQEMDSIKGEILKYPFYTGVLLNKENTTTLIGVTLDRKLLDSRYKVQMSDDIIAVSNHFGAKLDFKPKYSGLPYVRAYAVKYLPKEMIMFLLGAIMITVITLFLFFRSLTATIVPLLVIGIVVVWSLGIMGLLGFKITIISSVVPTLIVVIGIPNSIYLITKYHFEYLHTHNKIKSLVLVIQKIGIVTVMTNATTAVGFLVLYFTEIQILREFGILAGLSVVATFFISLLLIPIIFSFLPPPKERHTRHIDRKPINKAIQFLDAAVHGKRKAIYLVSFIAAILGIMGITKVRPVSYMLDDLPKGESISADLKFLEENFNGVMPFEIVVNTGKKQGLRRLSNLKKIEELQNRMKEYPEISTSISIVDVVKFSRQAFFGGDPKEYSLPTKDELNFILSDLKKGKKGIEDVSLATITDSTFKKTRIKASIKDVGSVKMDEIVSKIEADIRDIFIRNVSSGKLKENIEYQVYGENLVIKYGKKKHRFNDVFLADKGPEYEVLEGEGKLDVSKKAWVTGTTKIFIKGNKYLIQNLIQTFIIAFLIIALFMALLFRSYKMVLISLLPNFLPLLLLAGIMGWTGMFLKPSTVLVFSVAFGISVDDTIHYLVRYRQGRKYGNSVSEAVSNSFKDTGVSMIYTSIILFFGFIIFAFSTYGGTEALGKLTSITLGIALFTNLLLLPALLISWMRDEENPFKVKIKRAAPPERTGEILELVKEESNTHKDG